MHILEKVVPKSMHASQFVSGSILSRLRSSASGASSAAGDGVGGAAGAFFPRMMSSQERPLSLISKHPVDNNCKFLGWQPLSRFDLRLSDYSRKVLFALDHGRSPDPDRQQLACPDVVLMHGRIVIGGLTHDALQLQLSPGGDAFHCLCDNLRMPPDLVIYIRRELESVRKGSGALKGSRQVLVSQNPRSFSIGIVGVFQPWTSSPVSRNDRTAETRRANSAREARAVMAARSGVAASSTRLDRVSAYFSTAVIAREITTFGTGFVVASMAAIPRESASSRASDVAAPSSKSPSTERNRAEPFMLR